jgi:hypothetical protein
MPAMAEDGNAPGLLKGAAGLGKMGGRMAGTGWRSSAAGAVANRVVVHHWLARHRRA